MLEEIKTIIQDNYTYAEAAKQCKLSKDTIRRFMRGYEISNLSKEKLVRGLNSSEAEPFELTPPGADLDNLTLRAKGIIKSYEYIQRQAKLALEEWKVYEAKLTGLYGKVSDIRKTLGILGEK